MDTDNNDYLKVFSGGRGLEIKTSGLGHLGMLHRGLHPQLSFGLSRQGLPVYITYSDLTQCSPG